MFQVQELRSANTMANAKVSSLTQEVEDSERELGNATARIDLLTSQVEAHHVELGKLSKQHERELMKKESEVRGSSLCRRLHTTILATSEWVARVGGAVCLFVCLFFFLFVVMTSIILSV